MLVGATFCVCIVFQAWEGQAGMTETTSHPQNPQNLFLQVVTCHTQTWQQEHRNSPLTGPPHTTHNAHSWGVRCFAASSLFQHPHLTSAPGVGKKTNLQVNTEGREMREKHKTDTLQKEERSQFAGGISDQQQEHVDTLSCLVDIVGIPAQTHGLNHFSMQRSEQTGFPQAE